jgi:type IV pilus assembly protein PilV
MKSNEKPWVAIDMSRRRGFSLIEVLVALFVLSIGLLGLAALQTTSLRFNSDSLARTQATYLAYDIVDRMRANHLGVTANNYNVPNAAAATSAATNTCLASSCKCDSAGANCSTSDLAAYDLARWYGRLQSLLPGASTNLATISRDAATNVVTITISWTERDQQQPVSQTWVIQL